jgi:hypothetical protein
MIIVPIITIKEIIAVIIQHNPRRKNYGIKIVHVQRDILHEKFDFLCMFSIESTELSADDVTNYVMIQ